MPTHDGLPFEQYQALEGWNFSSLKHVAKTPAHALAARAGLLDDETEAKGFGTLAHLALLEPARFDALCVKVPDQRRGTKDWKALEAEHPGKALVKDADHHALMAIRSQVWAHPACAALLGRARREVVVQWTHEPTLLPCKARLDILSASGIVVDFKTCTSADPAAFSKAILSLNYHAQGAMYVEAAREATGHKHEYVLIAAEKEPPFAVAAYTLNDRAIEIGARRLTEWRFAVAHCIKTGKWPAYPSTIEEIGLPLWAERMEEQFDVSE